MDDHLAELLLMCDLLSLETAAATTHRSARSRHTAFHRALNEARRPLQTLVARVRFNAVGPVDEHEFLQETAHALIRFKKTLVRVVDAHFPPPRPCPRAVSDLLLSAKTARYKIEACVNRRVWLERHAAWWTGT